MKVELTLPPELLDLMADKLIEKLKPLLINSKASEPDTIFTPETLAEYLQVETSWIYKQVSLKAIPYFKSGKYTRFKKAVIDKWIETQTVRPIPLVKNAR